TILVPNGENNLSSIVGAFKIFSRANDHWKAKGNRPMFTIQLAGMSRTVSFHGDLFSVKPHVHINSITKTDLIIIPSLNHNFEQSIRENKKMVEWIAAQYHAGAEVASICTGAFLLAKTGLLNGKCCSTHWSASNTFRTMFPEVDLQSDQVITDENGIYTNGGAYSFLNLIIYLIEKYYNRQTAIYCAKIFQIEMDRQTQSEFRIFAGQKNHGDEVIQKAQEYIEKNIGDKLSVEELSVRFSLGRRNFDRRFVKATGNTPIEYAQRVKMECAKKAFESSRKNVNEVMYEVGYADPKAFRGVFKKITGMSPVEYRGRYNKEYSVV
ncbi:MAG: helix-turn-helix domain-containing protein, partial [Pedobacter sp.]